MSHEDREKREKRIRYNFASMTMLIAAIAISAVAGALYILMLLL